jgi:hypothetical protein
VNGKSDLVTTALCLLLLSGLGLLSFAALGPGQILFASYRPDNTLLLYAPALLPLLVLGGILLRSLAGGKNLVQNLAYIAAFLLLVHRPSEGALILGTQLALFWLDRHLPHTRALNSAFVAVGIAYLLLPIYLMAFNQEVFSLHLAAITIFREAFALRTFSWIVFRRIYERREFGSLQEFLEYFFCPIFFLLPSLLNLLSFGYFHESKLKEGAKIQKKNALLMGVWGISLMVVYSLSRLHFFDSVFASFLWERGARFDHWFLLGGFLSFLLIIIHHTGAMAFQVGLARFMGYGLRYDMCYPLLSRSPMELWRREHNYTRQFLIENALRPMTIFLMRRNLPKHWVFFFSALLAYGAMTVALGGWKPFGQENSASAGLGMIAFFSFTIFVPLLFWAFESRWRNRSRALRILVGLEPFNPLKDWRLLDYALCAGTLLLVSLAKAGIGLLRLLFD